MRVYSYPQCILYDIETRLEERNVNRSSIVVMILAGKTVVESTRSRVQMKRLQAWVFIIFLHGSPKIPDNDLCSQAHLFIRTTRATGNNHRKAGGLGYAQALLQIEKKNERQAGKR
jgi:hypothetical protein